MLFWLSVCKVALGSCVLARAPGQSPGRRLFCQAPHSVASRRRPRRRHPANGQLNRLHIHLRTVTNGWHWNRENKEPDPLNLWPWSRLIIGWCCERLWGSEDIGVISWLRWEREVEGNLCYRAPSFPTFQPTTPADESQIANPSHSVHCWLFRQYMMS